MKYVSMHPVEYLRAHLVYEKIRITILSLLTSPIIILLLLITIALGGLYTTLTQLDNVEPETADHASMNPFPYELPDFAIDPMSEVPLYWII